MYELIYKKSTLKALAKMPLNSRQKMLQTLKSVANRPDNITANWKPLSGSRCWRLRIDRYRAICDLRESELVLLVVKIGSRGDIYK
ncbi:type II toxin-antitoxin system RelE family toxin [Thiolapillus sp.]